MIVFTFILRNVELLEKSRNPCVPEISQKNTELQEVLKTVMQT